MKKSFFLSLLLTGLIAGCSSTPTSKSASTAAHVDKGPIKAKTFNFVDGGIALTPPATYRLSLTHQLIQTSIIKDLAAKGLTRTDGTGDVIVAYLIILGNSGSTESVDTYFGSNRGVDALLDKAHAAYSGSSNPNQFTAGTLLIDVIDAKTFELLYRDYAVEPVPENATTDQRAALIQKAADAALAKLIVAP